MVSYSFNEISAALVRLEVLMGRIIRHDLAMLPGSNIEVASSIYRNLNRRRRSAMTDRELALCTMVAVERVLPGLPDPADRKQMAQIVKALNEDCFMAGTLCLSQFAEYCDRLDAMASIPVC